ncbi:DUF4157 domain-containing protein [Pseudomonas sp. TCU-HL1]|uniref:eCIS core domain-containing protein n=1 Tax=Pseudomonas sp. TCU-HL1 TaxID=1856685 RepID=UPI00083CEA77|nr:DUF4157 domain-containing protein [Pseudomonas sp. TCU-HL1]AOE84147.1 hypothetical protein THL1_1599 [Pseudomonas sp. TCU-HL1]
MFAVSPRTLVRQTILALSFVSTTALACPAGQSQVCVVTCFCAPGNQGDMAPLLESVNQMASTSLQQWIVQSRNNMPATQLQPIPLHIRAQLEPYYDLQVLDTARYKVGVDTEMNAANTLMQNPDVEAVTLVDVIVFRNEDDAQNNVALWAHELHHVKQYLEWGVADFARRYTRDYNAVEAPAYKIQGEVARALKPTVASSGRKL